MLNSFANESISFNAMEKQTPGPQDFCFGIWGYGYFFSGSWGALVFRGAGEQARSFVDLGSPDKVKNKY